MTRTEGIQVLECPGLHVAAALYFVETSLYATAASLALAGAFASIAAIFALLAIASSADGGAWGVA